MKCPKKLDFLGHFFVLYFFLRNKLNQRILTEVGRNWMKRDKIRAAFKGVLGAYLLTGGLLLFLAFLMYRFYPSGELLKMGIVFTYLFSSFVGGFLAGRRAKERRFLWGLLTGFLYFLILFLVSIALGRDVFGNLGTTVTIFIMCTLGGMLGGMIS